MTDPVTPPTPKGAGKGVKILLAVSLALNLAVIGTVAGVALRGRDEGRPMQMAVRDLNFGPFTDALTRDQRRELLREFSQNGPGLREVRAQMRSDFDAVLAALRTTPFDAAAFQATVAAQSQRITARADAGRTALVGLILGMTDAERAEFAERLERSVKHRDRRDGDKGKQD